MFDIWGGARVVVESTSRTWSQSLPALAQWHHHLGYTPSLPWPLKLRVEVDGVLGSRVHEVVMHSRHLACAVSCAPAFCPLVGMQFISWRFMRQTSTLVFAVRTPIRGVAAETPAAVAPQHANTYPAVAEGAACSDLAVAAAAGPPPTTNTGQAVADVAECPGLGLAPGAAQPPPANTAVAVEVARPCKRQRFSDELQEMLVDLSCIAREVRGYWGL